MDDADPVFQFFPDQESVDLYAVLGLDASATPEAIKKAYRKLALTHHPDKHSSASAQEQKRASTLFQQVGYAYAVLSDDGRRARYDKTGRTDEGGLGFGPGDAEGGWEGYFEAIFEEVTRSKLDELKKEYQGSTEEQEDIIEAYTSSGGDIEVIMSHIPHTTYEDEPRVVAIIQNLIKSGQLSNLPQWQHALKDEKAKRSRKQKGKAEAAEAEKLAQEIGVWDEFYGTGKKGKRTAKSKPQPKEDEGLGNLQALIQKRSANRGTSFLDSLAAKYGVAEEAAEPPASKSSKKRRRAPDSDEDMSPRKNKKQKTPELDDAEFERIQERLVAGKSNRGGKRR